jgi:hypothetical protein
MNMTAYLSNSVGIIDCGLPWPDRLASFGQRLDIPSSRRSRPSSVLFIHIKGLLCTHVIVIYFGMSDKLSRDCNLAVYHDADMPKQEPGIKMFWIATPYYKQFTVIGTRFLKISALVELRFPSQVLSKED